MNTTFYKEIGKLSKTDDRIQSNLKLVVHLAKKYQGMGLSLEDLIQEGTVGLCKANEKYDEAKGKFSPYAGEWIKAMIRQALNKKSRTIRVPAHKTHLTEEAPVMTEISSAYKKSVEPDVYKDYTEDDNSHQIENLLKLLKPRQQEIIKLKFGIGCIEMKTIEIAKSLGLSVQAVNSNLRNALKIMKR